jgi:outer membrane protein assembly factor BamB
MKTRSLLLFTAFLLVSVLPALADDWPQFRGPNRDDVSKETGLLAKWPKNGPPLLWTCKDVGIGFSGPAIVGNRLYTMGGRKENEYLIALDISGAAPKELWTAKIGPIFSYMNWGDGPRSTPTVDGDRVYALGGYGELICAETATGNVVWRKNLEKDLGGEMMTAWGYSESPLVDGDYLICTPGGPNGTLAKLNKKSGAVVWRSKELKDKAPYSSIIAADIAGVRQYIQMTYVDDIKGGAAAGVSAKDGKLLWYFPFFDFYSFAVAPTPIVRGDQVYITAGYGAGCRLLKLSKNEKGLFEVKDLYPEENHKVMKNTHGGVVLVGDHVYGHCEEKGWVCQDFKTGESVWLDRNRLRCKSGSLTYADGHLYLYSDEGTAVLIKASPEKWIESGRFEIPEKSKVPETRKTSQAAKIWTHPVVANGRLYLRDQELLFCFDIRAKK